MVLSVKVMELGGNVGIMSFLKLGMWVFVICVDVVLGVFGFLRFGDCVDVYWIGCVVFGGGSLGISEVIKLI